MGNVDEVGFKRPPVHSRFRKGYSGNSRGRPKGTKIEGDRTVKMSKQRAVVKTLVAKTLKGDSRATSILSNMIFRALPFAEAADDIQ